MSSNSEDLSNFPNIMWQTLFGQQPNQECVGGKNHEKECFAFTRAGVKVDIDVTADNPAREYKVTQTMQLCRKSEEIFQNKGSNQKNW